MSKMIRNIIISQKDRNNSLLTKGITVSEELHIILLGKLLQRRRYNTTTGKVYLDYARLYLKIKKGGFCTVAL